MSRIPQLVQLANQKEWGRWTVIGEPYPKFDKSAGKNKWWVVCRCICGKDQDVRVASLIYGRSQSCGCYRIDVIRKKFNEVKVGDEFGYWTVVEKTELPRSDGKGNRPAVLCRCRCGTARKVLSETILSGTSLSCGCRKFENLKKANTTHGRSKIALYKVWSGMITRCTTDSSKPFYKDYAGRGITVCEEWRRDFVVFFVWAQANGYVKGLHLDRRENNAGYSPHNCRWVTRAENNRNKRSNVFITAWGEKQCVSAWARDPRCIVGSAALIYRLRTGWDPETAISSPIMRPGRKPKTEG